MAQCEKILAKDNLETMVEGTKKAFQDLKDTVEKNDKAARAALNDADANKGKPLTEMKAMAELPYQSRGHPSSCKASSCDSQRCP